jgi:hypothetical protein
MKIEFQLLCGGVKWQKVVVLCCWVAENDDVGASELRQNPCLVPDRHVKTSPRPANRYIIAADVKFALLSWSCFAFAMSGSPRCASFGMVSFMHEYHSFETSSSYSCNFG